LSTLNIKS